MAFWFLRGDNCTDLDNLTPLCSHHHQVHDRGWNLERLDGGLRFTGPDGRVLTGPPPERPCPYSTGDGPPTSGDPTSARKFR